MSQQQASPSPQAISRGSKGQSAGRRQTVRGHHLHSDCPPEPEDLLDHSPTLGQRSMSLTTLQTAVIQPRMAQLETLEAKMASIEVSLSTPRRRKSIIPASPSLRSLPKEVAVKELENLRNALRDRESLIQSLRGHLGGSRLGIAALKANGSRELSEGEKKQVEERLNRLKMDVENKRVTIKNLKVALEKLDITDNIDVRIQQAELEYQLGREELNLLTLLEETRTLQMCLEESNKISTQSHTLYSCVNGNDVVILVAVEATYDENNPKFGAAQRDSVPGLWVEWALEETGMCKDDRLVEVNGKLVLSRSREDLHRLLSAAPDPAQLVVYRRLPRRRDDITSASLHPMSRDQLASLREELETVREQAEEAQRTKDGLRNDNIRLTHRISYLEEQVSDLLNKKKPSLEKDLKPVSKAPVISTVKSSQNITNINITSHPNSNGQDGSANTNIQLFQKGPQVTALVSNHSSIDAMRLRSQSSLSNVSSTQITSTSPQLTEKYLCRKSHHHKHQKSASRHSLQPTRSSQEQLDNLSKHNHCPRQREKEYQSETDSVRDYLTYYNKKNVENGHRYTEDHNKANNGTEIMDQSYKKATKIVQELTKCKENPNLYEKHKRKCLLASDKYNSEILRHYNARKSSSVIDFRSEIHIGSKCSESKSVEELDVVDSSKNSPIICTNSNIHDARSVKSLDFDSDCNSTVNGYLSTGQRGVDYTSEPDYNRRMPHTVYYGEGKPKPTPPKKPLRLSLHKAQSLHSVETSSVGNYNSNGLRKSCKRNYKGGEVPMNIHSRTNGNCHDMKKEASLIKWSTYGNSQSQQRIVENGH